MLSMNAAFLTLCLSHAASAVHLNLYKRADAVTPPATINIPLFFDSNGRYIVPVGMSTGPNEQHFNFTLATSTGLTSVAGTGCGSCYQTNLYNLSESSTAKSLQGSDAVSLVDGAYNGSVIKEDCSMATAGEPWNYPNQTVIVAKTQDNGTVFGNGVSGVIGLGTNRNAAGGSSSSNYSAGFNDTIFGGWLGRNLEQSQFRYGMDINPPVAVPQSTSSGDANSNLQNATPKQDAGMLHWLSPDSSAYDTQQLAYKTAQSNSSVIYSTSSGQPDWTVQLDGWTFRSGGDVVSFQQEMVTTVDPYYTDIYMPFEQAQLLNNAISGSSLQSNVSTLGSQAQAWKVSCDAQFTFSVNINSQAFTLDQSILVVEMGNGLCYSGIEGWVDQSVQQYILGARFVSQVYVVFNITRDGTDSIGFAPRAVAKKSTHVGAIVGGAVGGVAGLLLIPIAVFFYLRSKQDRALLRQAAEMVEEHKAARAIEPYIIGSIEQTPQGSQFASPSQSPDFNSPLLPRTHVEHHDEVAPPSYESSQTVGPEPPTPAVREKGQYVRPTMPDAASSSGSPEAALVPNRASNFNTILE
ncbi:hypothetical protein AcW1_000129 [Taiwanofungus camphoratus]|nr:hypothetical protein AcW2_001379 [Antrodia cinnamomea]KAI0935669.1 hypothetical protein AcV5_004023 [Antrodia cinnamomea]KAI0962891.1 hypothetical protein AcW1_000129 [Antrodia cinnamomea]